MKMRLDDEVVRGFEMGKAHKHFAQPMNSLSFHREREFLIAATDDDAMYVYNVDTGEPSRPQPVYCRKYGVQCVTWTHSVNDVLHASSKAPQEGNHAVRYLSLESNQYHLYFEGHTGRVTSVDMSPKNDTFLSSAQDRTVRLWDTRTPTCQAVLATPAAPVAAFDQQGLVFAVGTDSGVVKLYDASQYQKGPFETFVVQELANRPTCFRQLIFSNDGNLLVAVADGTAYVLDAFTGAPRHAVRMAPHDAPQSQVSLSYDGAYLISGCDATGAVGVWSTATGQQVAAWREAAADATPRCVAWAPRRLMAASGSVMLAMWIPGARARERAAALG